MPQVVDSKHLQAAQLFKQIYATYRQNQDLINIGAYSAGSDPQIDHAIQMFPKLRHVLKQDMQQAHDWQQSVDNLLQTLQSPPNAASPPVRTVTAR